MGCFWPLKGYKAGLTENGKTKIVFARKESERAEEIYLPCGSCEGCKLDHARQWAHRCVHEASLYERNCFLTLTYADDYLPAGGSLDVSEVQRFVKRLRKSLGPDGPRIKYLCCGEYGPKFGRPHYHMVLFNYDFEDKVPYRLYRGNMWYRSAELEKLWPFGFSTVGSVTSASAGYVARYSLKKVRKRDQDVPDSNGLLPYERINLETGETWMVTPEFLLMSRGGRGGRGGIGHGWFTKFRSDVFPSDEVIMDGMKFKPPKYYLNLLGTFDAEMLALVKAKREEKAEKLVDVGAGVLVNDYTDPWRCEVRETCLRQKLELLKRPMEEI